MTYFPVSDLCSVDIDVSNIELSEHFYTTVWGLEVVARKGPIVYLRATGTEHHVLALHPSEAPNLRMVTFRADSITTLEAIASRTPQFGGTLLEPVQKNTGPEGGTSLLIRSPEGWILQFVAGGRLHEVGGPEPNLPLRLAHVNLNTPNYERAMCFMEDVAGFKRTDRSAAMAFVRCNADHHSVVIANSPVAGLNHIAFLMPDLESVMRGAGRMIDAGYPIAWGVGRHGPGNNVFAYFLDPDGFVIEYTAEVLQVDDNYRFRGPTEWTWPPGRTDHWGIAPPKEDRVKKAQLAIHFVTR